ncbi:VanW family protein [Ammonifex thiophilus]|uniref:Vanomycin resistance protein VanB n=1 Tax=Ammonifex thiophilus TaxID=444093 RepID=A0A3D8P3E6_9THEO|nr:VanW family protein [Ammonifex thiophilus]RDV81762.1 vanomycin resistance protein VanB [Ammonifex thiophilus]
MRRAVWVGACAFFLLALATALLACYDKTYPAGVIPAGVYIDGYYVGGKTAGEAAAWLNCLEKDLLARTVRVECASRDWLVPLAELGVKLDRSVLEEALAVGHRGWLGQRLWERWHVERKGLHLPLQFSVDRQRLVATLQDLTKELTVPPQNAAFRVLPNDTIVIIPSREGRCADVEAAYPQLSAILNEGREPVIKLPLKPIPPEHTTEDVKNMGLECLLAQFTTKFDPSNANRVYNISIAATAFNGLLVAPGEVVSFNQVVGPRSAKAGYKEAPTIIEDRFVDTVGGGICQVSTTLYNAVLLAGLKVVERYAHSLPVNYVPLGRDATVSYGGFDFKFQNNTDKYLYLRTIVGPDFLTVKIYGNGRFKRQVEIRTWVTEEIPFKVVREEDPDLEKGKEIVKQKGQKGYRVSAERIIWEGGKARREALPSSHYKPVDEIVVVGTKAVPRLVVPERPEGKVSDENPAASAEVPASSQR